MEELKLVKRGSESLIYYGVFQGIRAIYKIRSTKAYRHQLIDKKLNAERTLSEAKIMFAALLSGINTPAILFVDPGKYTIIMEYLAGPTIKDAVSTTASLEVFKEIGYMTGKMHKNEIIHGDLTTNNMILHDNQVFFIDFGLSKRSRDIEDMATEVHVFLRSLESVHPEIKDEAFSIFLDGYQEASGMKKEVLQKMEEIRMRGRYVDERRNKTRNR
ncbi:Kae1-associated kinase Bud32 [Metallosphaera hakonensis]|uniref:non-specific serine/threonine protein kinase n=1 Tax=Metallosphaera hakonensis JCM 8857 = DSM 7519 TaxID=1293036 RepID=A0A2U9IU79_9CREN|nr:Kae1-associated kinase Bud32 [Metallosphaera hakonensis]AWR99543.1 Kae1-associated kinase Bud32 [Metallosphaera hakonensis JCM 8857 = DSM 7519]